MRVIARVARSSRCSGVRLNREAGARPARLLPHRKVPLRHRRSVHADDDPGLASRPGRQIVDPRLESRLRRAGLLPEVLGRSASQFSQRRRRLTYRALARNDVTPRYVVIACSPGRGSGKLAASNRPAGPVPPQAPVDESVRATQRITAVVIRSLFDQRPALHRKPVDKRLPTGVAQIPPAMSRTEDRQRRWRACRTATKEHTHVDATCPG